MDSHCGAIDEAKSAPEAGSTHELPVKTETCARVAGTGAPVGTGGLAIADSDGVLVEICVDCLASARAAETAGAGRLELCSSLVEGGITPSIGLIESVVASVSIPVNVLVRPRGGDFCYSRDEVAVMCRDVEAARTAGASGIVIGALLPDGSVDVDTMKQLITAARPCSVTFHRAIDVCNDVNAAFEACTALGIDRVLTSGQCSTAAMGADTIRSLVQKGGVVVMAGGGVRGKNVAELIAATGVTEVHGTARTDVPSRMEYRPSPPVYMGGEKVNTPESEFQQRQCTVETVAEMVSGALAASPGAEQAASATGAHTC